MKDDILDLLEDDNIHTNERAVALIEDFRIKRILDSILSTKHTSRNHFRNPPDYVLLNMIRVPSDATADDCRIVLHLMRFAVRFGIGNEKVKWCARKIFDFSRRDSLNEVSLQIAKRRASNFIKAVINYNAEYVTGNTPELDNAFFFLRSIKVSGINLLDFASVMIEEKSQCDAIFYLLGRQWMTKN